MVVIGQIQIMITHSLTLTSISTMSIPRDNQIKVIEN